MLFRETDLAGAFVIEPERRVDERGYFARLFCESELAERGLEGRVRQINTGFSPRAGTLRGMHYQTPPHAEAKIVRCLRGAVFDVVIDLRPGSPTFKRWYGIELTVENGLLLYAPPGTAHGYLTLRNDSELLYATSAAYAPNAAHGVRYDDEAFGIVWPADIHVISTADCSWRAFSG